MLAPRVAPALPMFGGGRGDACSECHLAVPRLGMGGVAFLLNGERPGGAMVASHPSTAAFPLSFTATLGASVSRRGPGLGRDGLESLTTDTAGLQSFTLHAAGDEWRRLSYRFAVEARDHTLDTEQAYLQLNDALPAGRLNLKLGAYRAELPFLSNELRTTLHEYLAPVTVNARGVELNGAASRWSYGAGVVESERDFPGRGPVAETLDRLQDGEYWVMRSAGQDALGARMLFDRQNSTLPSLTWMQHIQAEVGGLIVAGRLTLLPGYVFDRFDDRPAAGIHEHHHYALLEALAPLDSRRRWTLTARYEHDYRVQTVLTREWDRQLGLLNLSFAPIPNASIAAEWAGTADNFEHREVSMLELGIHITR